jgi:hypothetical protein
MKNQLTTVVLALTVAMMFLVPRQLLGEENQPHMQAALHHLQEAAEELQKAEHDKGGHRERALDLTQRAMNQVKAGMHYDTSREGKGEGMKNNSKKQQ